mmetsp:Transcript_52182/g.137082  ORF Transcript_52182/g.137082 Transcript_52182/m.137082 type:complete len:204 (-) Transcript_52182:984-1595(-)
MSARGSGCASKASVVMASIIKIAALWSTFSMRLNKVLLRRLAKPTRPLRGSHCVSSETSSGGCTRATRCGNKDLRVSEEEGSLVCDGDKSNGALARRVPFPSCGGSTQISAGSDESGAAELAAVPEICGARPTKLETRFELTCVCKTGAPASHASRACASATYRSSGESSTKVVVHELCCPPWPCGGSSKKKQSAVSQATEDL